MYAAGDDPYCYPDTTVLKNRPGIRDQAALDAFEAISTAQRADEPLPHGRLSVTHYRAIHRHLFQDVYAWAGNFRTVRISKGESVFCYPENIAKEMRRLFAGLPRTDLTRLSRDEFLTQAARFLSELNAIHPFREDNGRSQLTYLLVLADRASHPVDLERLNPQGFLRAMIASFSGDESLLQTELERIIR